jgi:hypothetical protein
MNVMSRTLAVMLFLALCSPRSAAARAPEPITVSNKQLLVNGQPFVVKGVNYNPTPNTAPDYWPDDWTMNTNTVFRDLAKMKEMGVNTIRVYVKYDRLFGNWDERNDPATDLGRVNTTVLDNYRAVMAEADRLGIYVIMNYSLPENGQYQPGQDVRFGRDARSRHKLRFRNVIHVFRDRQAFPMVLMWAFGNENNFPGKSGGLTTPQLFAYYQEAISEAKSEADTTHPYTVVLGDNWERDIHSTTLLGSAPSVDIWSLNTYNTEQGFRDLIQGYTTNKPLLFMEFGYDACNQNVGCDYTTPAGNGFLEAQQNQANFYKSRWENAMQPNLSAYNSARPLLGGLAFEWNDEWWKAPGLPFDAHDNWGLQNDNLGPDNYMNEEWFGLGTAVPANDTNGRYYRAAFYELKRMWASSQVPGPQVINPSFAQDGWTQQPTGWSTWSPNGAEDADFAETHGGRQANDYHGTHYKAVPYHVFTYQRLTGLTNGTYTLRAWVRSNGGQTRAEMHAKEFDGTTTIIRLTVPATDTWTQVSIPNIAVTAGQLTIGFLSDAPAYSYLYFDDVEVFRQ